MTIKDMQLLSLMEQLAPAGGSASSDDIARVWLTIMHKFTPLIGANSMLLMFERSLEFHQSAFGWLPVLLLPMHTDGAIEQLRKSMENRTGDTIAAVHHAILLTFIDLMTTLIGTRLTIQFLRAAFPADGASGTTEEKPG